jgi:hypothetical protein
MILPALQNPGQRLHSFHLSFREATMRRPFALLSVLLLALTVTPAFADIAAIHANALPQESPILAALDDARQLEPYVSAWTNDWKHPIAKGEVAKRLEKDLDFLGAAFQKHPDNAELALLTGLVAHYAYNVDVADSHDKAVLAFEAAQKLTPTDMRTTWFHADLLCQTKETEAGAREFLDLESTHPWDQLPSAFWGDYMYCATVTNMPAHVLRAASYLERLHAPNSQMRTFLTDNASKRFDAFNPEKKYDPKEVWTGANAGDATKFTSTLCGMRFTVPGQWGVDQLAFSNHSCVALFSSGPYKAATRDLRPSVLVLVQQPAADEKLEAFLKKFTSKGAFEPFTPSRCPATTCLAVKGVQTGMYKADGDGHGHIVAIERDEPEFPGLLFESPTAFPNGDAANEPQFLRPAQTQKRIPGKLFYLVLLDTAASIETPAMADYNLFLKNLTVE